ncbi:PQQ-binding-like beta-propeller repeat protein [Jannaschia formosa]|uniref:PQQ-binding-like beta-propeller repeat protein n=1 Tax=Jannaschia formosa TaxID=2259592 RepID=UPI000E1BC033|nr:hypothetical protein DR046_08345 [Jannaschia formosa]
MARSILRDIRDGASVKSRQVVWLLPEQLWLEGVPVLHRLQGRPRPGEPGNETWAEDSWETGGATVWTTPVADAELDLVYVTTGNAALDLNGSERAGDNLYSVSVLALDSESGGLKWHFQEVHHDLWDYDAAQPVDLFTLEAVLRVLRGEDLELVSRELETTAAALSGWRDDFLPARAASIRVPPRMTYAYMNQPIEVPELRSRLRAATGVSGVPQLLLRVGVGADVPASSRREVDEVLIQ